MTDPLSAAIGHMMNAKFALECGTKREAIDILGRGIALARSHTSGRDEQMIELIARALCAANFAKKGAEGEFGTVDDCWWVWTDEARAALSQGTEAQRATTVEQGVVHDGPVAKPCAQTPGGGGK